MAHRELEKMGPMKRNEKVLLVLFFIILTLWVTSEWNNLDATVVALVGVGFPWWKGPGTMVKGGGEKSPFGPEN